MVEAQPKQPSSQPSRDLEADHATFLRLMPRIRHLWNAHQVSEAHRECAAEEAAGKEEEEAVRG